MNHEFVRPLRQRRARRWTTRNVIHAALTAIGVVFAGIYVLAQIDSQLGSLFAIERFTSSVGKGAETQTAATEEEIPTVKPAFDGWSKERILAYEKASDLQKSVPEAVLEVAKVKVKAPVFEGTDALTLNHAVGHIAGTAQPGEPGNVGIAGHRDGFFRGLKGIRAGDEIDLRTRKGTDRYTVDQIEIVSPHEVRVLQAGGRSSLTLVTCYPFYFIGGAPKRFVVRANLKQHIPAGTLSTEPRLNTQPTNSSQED
jgi:sortase A